MSILQKRVGPIPGLCPPKQKMRLLPLSVKAR